MRELERLPPSLPEPARALRAATADDGTPRAATADDGTIAGDGTLRVAIVGNGRLGNALTDALTAAGIDVAGPLHRGEPPPAHADAVLLCVPDAEIAGAAAAVPAGPPVGHCSGATGLGVLGDRTAFSLHPLMTVTADGAGFSGAGAAVAGSTPGALGLARRLAQAAGMRPIEVAPEDRAAYHAAASIASNFLVTLEAAAECLAGTAGVTRQDLVPLVRATVENWARLGPERALTGPVARGDDDTVQAQREAVAERAPDLLPLFDAMVAATRAHAGALHAGAPHAGALPAGAGAVHAGATA